MVRAPQSARQLRSCRRSSPSPPISKKDEAKNPFQNLVKQVAKHLDAVKKIKRVTFKSPRKSLSTPAATPKMVHTKGYPGRPLKIRPFAIVVREIRRYQNSVEHLIPKRSFKRLVSEVTQNFRGGTRVSAEAVEALQDATEAYLVDLLKKADMCAFKEKRMTVTAEDMKLVRRIRDEIN